MVLRKYLTGSLNVAGIQFLFGAGLALIDILTRGNTIFFKITDVSLFIRHSLLVFSYSILFMGVLLLCGVLYLMSKIPWMGFIWDELHFKMNIISVNICFALFILFVEPVITLIPSYGVTLKIISGVAFVILLFLLYLLLKKVLKKYYKNINYIITPLMIIVFLYSLIGISFIIYTNIDKGEVEYNERTNIILISIDTLRKDHLPVYGYEWSKTPNIDILAEDSLVFENCFATSPWTLPSMASMLTSQYPSIHNSGLDKMVRINPSLITLQKILKENGYTTLSFNANCIMSKRLGYGENFAYYDVYHRKIREYIPNRIISILDDIMRISGEYIPLGFRDTTNWLDKEILNDLDKIKKRPLFIWIHYLDPHNPYTPPEKYLPKNREYLRDNLMKRDYMTEELIDMIWHYDGEIQYVDDSLGRVFDRFKEMEIYDNSLIILTADHGEEFKEHGGLIHGHTQYSELVKIPLIIHPPKNYDVERGYYSSYCSLIDIPPTVLAFLEIDGDFEFEGQNLFELITDEKDKSFENNRSTPTDNYKRPIFTEYIAYKFIDVSKEDTKSIYYGDYHLLYDFKTDEYELYNIKEDLFEQNDISDDNPEISEELVAKLISWYKENIYELERIGPPEHINLSDEEVENLRGLGYIIY